MTLPPPALRLLALLLWTCTPLRPAAAAGAPATGFAALDAWQLEDALACGAAALRNAPDDPAAQLLAAEALHQRGHYDPAERLACEAAAQLAGKGGAAHEALGQRLAALGPPLVTSAATARDFACEETAHFRLCGADKDAIVVHAAGEVAERAYAGVARALAFAPAERGEKIVVEFYPTPAALAGATGLRAREIETSGTIAVCRFHRLMLLSPRATRFGYAWADTLAHEFVHLVVSKKSHNQVPVWLHEGLAKTLESAWRTESPPPLSARQNAQLAQAVAEDTLVPLKRMHPSMAKLQSQEEAALAFAEVASLVGYLRSRYGFAPMVALLEALGRGTPFATALAQHYAPLPTLERQWHAWLRRRYARPGKARTAPLARAQPLQLRAGDGHGPVRAPAPIESIADPNVRSQVRLGELLALRGHHVAAAQALAAAEALAPGRYVQVAFRLAEALHASEHDAQARDVLARALHPPAPTPGAARLRAEIDPEADDAGMRREAGLLYAALLASCGEHGRARPYLQAYNLHNPFHPQVHALLAQGLAAEGDAAGAAREQAFAALAAAPSAAPARTPPSGLAAVCAAQAQPLPEGQGTLDVLPVAWVPHLLDGDQTVDTPLWRHHVAAGTHCVRPVAEGAAARTPDGQRHEAGQADAPGARCVAVAAQRRATLRP